MISSLPTDLAYMTARPNGMLLASQLSGHCRLVRVCNCCPRLGQGLVGATAVVVGTVGEEEVDDEADDGEDEDTQAPEQLVDGRAVGLEDLDCVGRRSG